MVNGTVRKMFFFLKPTDKIAQFVPGNVPGSLIQETGKIIEISPDISRIGFYGMVSKTAKGDHLPKLI